VSRLPLNILRVLDSLN